MASLGSGNVTIAYPNGDRNVDTTITNRKKVVNLKLTIASGEWPAAGVPLPGAGSVGMVRNLDYYLITSPRLVTASGKTLIVALTTGNKVRLYTNGLMSLTGRSITALATNITVGAKIFYATAWGW